MAGNRELIERFEKKIQQTLARIWGDPAIPLETRVSAARTDIAYLPGLFACYVLNALAGDANCGRTKLEKCNHLAEYHGAVPLGRHAVRRQFGPVDYEQLKRVETWAGEIDAFTTLDPGDKAQVIYTPGPTLADQVKSAAEMLGPQKAEVDRLLKLLRPLKTRECEILATVYTAWNDLLLAGTKPTDPEIIHDIRHHWHSSKQAIPDGNWSWGIHWLQTNRIVPTGTGRAIGLPT